MRTAGFVVLLGGVLVIYLGITGKMGAFWTAVTTGQVPIASGGSSTQRPVSNTGAPIPANPYALGRFGGITP